MLMNPVVLLPLPAALALLGLLAYAALRRTDRWPTYPALPATPAEPPRHRLSRTPAPCPPRPWTEVTAETPTVPVVAGPERIIDPLDARVPIEEVERLATRLEEIRKANDRRMWSWSDRLALGSAYVMIRADDEATRELAAV